MCGYCGTIKLMSEEQAERFSNALKKEADKLKEQISESKQGTVYKYKIQPYDFSTKLPFAIKPKQQHYQDRQKEIVLAMLSRIDNSMPIPIEWANELQDIIEELEWDSERK